MVDSIALGPDGQVNHALTILRNDSREGALETHVHFLHGVDLRADPALDLKGQYRSAEGALLELEMHPHGQGDWCALHLVFPAPDLRGHGVLGFALRGAAAQMQVLRACLRSGTPEGFVDCFFDKHVLLHAEESSHVDALPVGHRETLPLEASWRELILFLPPKECDLSLIDLRVFFV